MSMVLQTVEVHTDLCRLVVLHRLVAHQSAGALFATVADTTNCREMSLSAYRTHEVAYTDTTLVTRSVLRLRGATGAALCC